VSRGEPLLDIRAVSKTFGSTAALEQLDLQLQEGELLTLLGPSGSGKTTLLKIIAGFEAPTGGQVLLRGRDISRLAPAQRGVGMVFQHYALFPHMTVAQNLAYGLKLRRRPRRERERRVGELLALLHLPGLEDRYPRQLSGGQQQRVALGRALAYDPEIVLMDEPLGALDRALRVEMEAEIRRLHRDLHTTIVYVTHDQQEALALSDRIAVLRAGRLVGLGTPEHLFRRPANSFVAGFFANANLLVVEAHELESDGCARVRCAGTDIRCPATASAEEGVLLAVRRRSFTREPSQGALTLRGTVAEILPLGDSREILLQVPALGRVVAVMDDPECRDLRVGGPVELYVPAGEPVLVPEL
jgi:putative spermidine/putrescine transport system ATP-binding protein